MLVVYEVRQMRKIIRHRSDPDEEIPYWVECPSLGIDSYGESIDDAICMIHEAIELHIEDLLPHGETDFPLLERCQRQQARNLFRVARSEQSFARQI